MSWVNTKTTSGERKILARWRGGKAGQPGYQFKLVSGKIGFGINGGGVPVGNTILTTNTWNHVAGVFNGTGGTYYLNGQPDGSGNSDTGAVNFTNMETVIGAVDSANDGLPNTDGFNGLIDEIRVYNRSLSATEIKAAAGASKDDYIYKPEGNFTSQIFNANSTVSWSKLNWTELFRYRQALEPDEIDTNVSLALHFDSRSDSNGGELPFDPTGGVLLMHFNNNSAIGENATYVVDSALGINNGTAKNATGACGIEGACPSFTASGKLGAGALEFDGLGDYVD